LGKYYFGQQEIYKANCSAINNKGGRGAHFRMQ